MKKLFSNPIATKKNAIIPPTKEAATKEFPKLLNPVPNKVTKTVAKTINKPIGLPMLDTEPLLTVSPTPLTKETKGLLLLLQFISSKAIFFMLHLPY